MKLNGNLEVEINFDVLKELLPDLIEQHFPKGKCKERGHAIVLGAELLIKIQETHPQWLKVKYET